MFSVMLVFTFPDLCYMCGHFEFHASLMHVSFLEIEKQNGGSVFS